MLDISMSHSPFMGCLADGPSIPFFYAHVTIDSKSRNISTHTTLLNSTCIRVTIMLHWLQLKHERNLKW